MRSWLGTVIVKKLEARHLDHFGLDLLCLNVRRLDTNPNGLGKSSATATAISTIGSRMSRQHSGQLFVSVRGMNEIASDASVAL